MEDREKIIEGLEKAYEKLIEFKKYKKSPLITLRDGKVIEIPYDKIQPAKYIHK